ncbi:hypothetical protein Gogos_004977, partial [Gossypium gossypioides]|nr:hypothetical protein [Gossypium gossypioides]
RGEEVSITPREICEFYDTLFYDKNFLSGTDLDKFENIDIEDVIEYLTQAQASLCGQMDLLRNEAMQA